MSTPDTKSTPTEIAEFITDELTTGNLYMLIGLQVAADAHYDRAGLGIALFRKVHPVEAAEFEKQHLNRDSVVKALETELRTAMEPDP